MIYGSVCSGIEAASLAWEPLGWNPAWVAEIEPFPSAVLAHTLGRNQGQENAVLVKGVRSLTPVECERLQGFPDSYTLITYRGKPAADGHRYKALGNSMAVPVMRWIGERIKLHLEAL